MQQQQHAFCVVCGVREPIVVPLAGPLYCFDCRMKRQIEEKGELLARLKEVYPPSEKKAIVVNCRRCGREAKVEPSFDVDGEPFICVGCQWEVGGGGEREDRAKMSRIVFTAEALEEAQLVPVAPLPPSGSASV